MKSLDLALWRPLSLALALVLYGLFSLPAPPGIGLGEGVIAFLVAAAIGPRHGILFATGLILRDGEARRLEAVGAVAFVILLWVPLARGLWLGWDADDIARDVLPLGFLFLPAVLLRPLESPREAASMILAVGLTMAGIAFAFRWWAEARWGFGAVGVRAMGDGNAYLLNSPAVLFAALALPFAGFAALLRRDPVGIAVGALCAVAAALCVTALAGAVHRVALFFVAAVGVLFVGWWLRRAPVLLVGALLLGVVAVAAMPGPVVGTLELVATKSRLVGANARPAEVMAVVEQVGRSPAAFLLGDGWGALVANPAVGGWRVSYTHSFASYLLLKTGAIGCLAATGYFACLGRSAISLIRHRPAWAATVLPPLFIGFVLHTSFKFLCFGMLLVVLVLAGAEKSRVS